MFPVPENAEKILQTLEKHGYESYVVGGCVRDSLLGCTPEDWDITTSATPSQVKALFPKTFDTGIRHGTVTVLIDHTPFEVTTFRQDGDYVNHRTPAQVEFTTSIEEDLARRDFTVNAMAYNPSRGLVDPFGGQKDLEKSLLRCVGDANLRFTEDALRMLRAVRFSAQKGFDIEKNTWEAIEKNCALVQSLSVERVISEVEKILLSDRPEQLYSLYQTGILSYIMPEMVACFETPQHIKWHMYDVGWHTIHAISHLEKKSYLRFAMLMHDWGKPLTRSQNPDGSDCFRNHAKESVRLAEDFLHRYKFSNENKDKILRLIQYHDREILTEKRYVKRAINAVGDDIFLDLLEVKRADAKGQTLSLTAPRLLVYDELERLYHEIKENKEPFCVRDLKINGRDLLSLGYQGKEIGNALNRLTEHVLEHPEDNEKEMLLSLIKKM